MDGGPMKKTAFVFDEIYLWHDTGHAALECPPGLRVQPDAHVENPEAKRRIKNLLDVCGLSDKLTALKPRPATTAEVQKLHAPEYISRIKELSDNGGGNAGENALLDAPFGRGSYEIAMLAAGGAVTAAETVLQGGADNAYALVRPPGHHATANAGMGFCIFNNAAIAIRRILDADPDARVAHVDWDVHHGNGTQDMFYGEPRALTISIHQDNCYPPESGAAEETGAASAPGGNINLPLPPGCGNGVYIALMEEIVAPAIAAHKPDIITVSCGLDAAAADPLGRMMLTACGYRRMARILLDAADSLCGGKLAMWHEGGYSPAMAPYCALAIMEELCGFQTGVPDPFADYARMGGQSVLPHQREHLSRLRAFFEKIRRGI